MPVKGKRSQWEREDNRAKVFKLLYNKPYRYNELFRASGFSSKSTLNNHLKDLMENQIVEKAIVNGKMVYRVSLDEKTLESEFKKMNFDVLLEFISANDPEWGLLLKIMMWGAIQGTIFDKTRLIEGKKEASLEERIRFVQKHPSGLDLSEDEKKLMSTDRYRQLLSSTTQLLGLEDLREEANEFL